MFHWAQSRTLDENDYFDRLLVDRGIHESRLLCLIFQLLLW